MAILAIVSGKGGTGKTTLSVAISHELSKVGRVLLVDLDFFNRGLTGLFTTSVRDNNAVNLPAPTGGSAQTAASDSSQASSSSAWDVVAIDAKLSCARCSQASHDDTLTYTLESASSYLRVFLKSVAESSCFDFVVFDCHGGPEVFSLAACQVATYGVVVAEPDRHSLHGTLAFVKALKKATGDSHCSLRMVFNRVSENVSASFLVRLYETYLIDTFDKNDLLAVVPSEEFISKVVGRYPVPTKLYPFSLLARKMELLVCDLVQRSDAPFASAPLLLRNLVRAARFRATGRRAPTRLYRLFSAMLVVLLAMTAVDVGVRSGEWGEFDVNTLASYASGHVALVWSFTAVLFGLMTAAVFGQWILWASDVFTVFARTRRALRSVVPLVAVVVMVAPSAYLLVSITGIMGRMEEIDDALDAGANVLDVPTWVLGLLGGALMFPMAALAVRGTAALWEECVRCLQTMGDRDKRWEFFGRAMVVIGAVAAGVVAWWRW